jgi:hypothetical protein
MEKALQLALEALEKISMGGDPRRADLAITAIKAALEAKDEPWEKFCDSNCVWTDHHPDCKLAQRTWVGLTPTDWLEALKDIDPETKRLPQGFSLFACAIEAKLKEKNT